MLSAVEAYLVVRLNLKWWCTLKVDLSLAISSRYLCSKGCQTARFQFPTGRYFSSRLLCLRMTLGPNHPLIQQASGGPFLRIKTVISWNRLLAIITWDLKCMEILTHVSIHLNDVVLWHCLWAIIMYCYDNFTIKISRKYCTVHEAAFYVSTPYQERLGLSPRSLLSTVTKTISSVCPSNFMSLFKRNNHQPGKSGFSFIYYF